MKAIRECVSCLILTADHQILLQKRDDDCDRFPGYLAPFGGGIDAGESPTDAMIRELSEELGAKINKDELIILGEMIDQYEAYKERVHLFFWHDIENKISGCYEGYPTYFKNVNTAMKQCQFKKAMNDVIWLLGECNKRKLIR